MIVLLMFLLITRMNESDLCLYRFVVPNHSQSHYLLENVGFYIALTIVIV